MALPFSPEGTQKKNRFRPALERLDDRAAPTFMSHPFMVGFTPIMVNVNVNTNVNVNVNVNINIVNVIIGTGTTSTTTPAKKGVNFRIGKVIGRTEIEAVDVTTGVVRAKFTIRHEGASKHFETDVNQDTVADLVVVFVKNGRTRVRAFSGVDGAEIAVARAQARALAGSSASSSATAGSSSS